MDKLIMIWATTILLVGCLDNKNKKNPTEIIRDIVDGTPQDLPLPSPDPAPSPRPDVKPKCSEYCNTKNGLLKAVDDYAFMSFVNFGYRGIGRCRGHAIITQNLSKLAYFDKNDRSCEASDYNSECSSIALEKVKNILNYQAQKIPGFSDIYTLSQHPKINAYLKMRVRSISHKYSARSVRINNPRYEDEFKNIFYEIIRRIEKQHEPYIGIKGFSIGDHALLGYEYKKTSYGDTICVRDSNYIPMYGLNCQSILYMEDDKIFYKRADLSATQLFIFNLMTDEDARVTKYEAAQKSYCLANAPVEGHCSL